MAQQHRLMRKGKRRTAGREAGTHLDGRPAAGVGVEPGAVPPLADEALDGGVQRPALLLLHGGRRRRRRRGGVRAAVVLPALLPRAATELQQRRRREREAENQQRAAATASGPHGRTNQQEPDSTPLLPRSESQNWIERSAPAPAI